MNQKQNETDHEEPAEQETTSEETLSETEADDAVEETVDPMEQLRAERDEWNDKCLRAVAELDNFRKRSILQQQRASQFSVATLVRELLPVIDNMERALLAANEGQDFESLAQGIQMVDQQIHQTLTANKIEQIEALHRPFNPNFHEVVTQEESDEHEEGTIVKVFEKGFKIGDIVIRAAKVAVAKAAAVNEPSEQDNRSNGDQ